MIVTSAHDQRSSHACVGRWAPERSCPIRYPFFPRVCGEVHKLGNLRCLRVVLPTRVWGGAVTMTVGGWLESSSHACVGRWSVLSSSSHACVGRCRCTSWSSFVCSSHACVGRCLIRSPGRPDMRFFPRVCGEVGSATGIMLSFGVLPARVWGGVRVLPTRVWGDACVCVCGGTNG